MARRAPLSAAALARLNRIGIALSAERDPDRVLSLILTSARELIGCDAASLFLVRKRAGAAADRRRFLADKELVFQLAQNDSVRFPFKRTAMPIDRKSIAGFTALANRPVAIRDAYRIGKRAPYRFSRAFDEATGYRTVSMLAVPMTNQKGERIGVIQLINRRKNPRRPLGRGFSAERVLPFDKPSVELAMSLASQATVAIENNLLYEEIRNGFDLFVRASVSAIESRDPTTAGHSGRVARLTTALARAVDAEREGPFRRLRFGAEALRQIEYASLLHDFGKIGVRERILVKAKKLFPEELAGVESRARQIQLGLRCDAIQRKLDRLLADRALPAERLRTEDEALSRSLADLSADLDLIRKANEPALLEEEVSSGLARIRERTYAFPDCDALSLLSDGEAERLGIRKGSLSEEERRAIESHVTHTYRYLLRIPWPKELARVPEIAYAHHEKLDGRGYPQGLSGEQIPIESRMMTIADIYDALTASDRPYKKAVPVDRALRILQEEAGQGMLDPELLRIFMDKRVYEATMRQEGLGNGDDASL